jgi:two-component system chemotaxis response regulator CheB
MRRLLLIGLSAGGYPLLRQILSALPPTYPLPVVVVAHLPGRSESFLAELLQTISSLPVGMATDKQALLSGQVYLAPPDYHLLIEQKAGSALSLALSVDEPVQSVRPSIDVLFESAAEVLESDVIAVLLSGANADGAQGVATVQRLGGLGVVLCPQAAEFSTMPEAAIKLVAVDYVLALPEIIDLLLSLPDDS